MTFFASPVSFCIRKINTHIVDIGIDPTIPSLLWHAQKQNNAGAIVYIQLLHLVFPLWNWYLFSSKGLHCPPLDSSCHNPQCTLGLSPFPRDWLSRNTLKSSTPCSDTLLCDTHLFSGTDYHWTHWRVPDSVMIHSRRGVEEGGEPDVCDQFHRLLIRVLVLRCQGGMGVQCTQ